MSWTEADLTALERAIARGVRRVRYADREVEYASISEMLELRQTMRESLQGTARPKQWYGRVGGQGL